MTLLTSWSKVKDSRDTLTTCDEEVTKSDNNSDCDYSISEFSFRYYLYVFWLKELMSHAEGDTSFFGTRTGDVEVYQQEFHLAVSQN